MKIIGITGGVGAGKTQVLEYLNNKYGASICQTDKVGKKLQKKGGEVIGVNTFTIDGDKAAIKEAKDILSKKKITYKNVWFATNSEAGKFTSGLFSYPTTYVVDQKGNIVGEPIVGAITAKDQAKRLNELIDQAIENGK